MYREHEVRTTPPLLERADKKDVPLEMDRLTKYLDELSTAVDVLREVLMPVLPDGGDLQGMRPDTNVEERTARPLVALAESLHDRSLLVGDITTRVRAMIDNAQI